jgi:serine/threonine protein kinase
MPFISNGQFFIHKGTRFGKSPTSKLQQSQSSLLSIDGRGTEGYYPPEFFEEIGDLKYNTSLDIWQMGCILFEFAVGKRAFRFNLDTQKFREGRTTLDIDLDDYFGEDCKEEIRRCVTWMLHIEPSHRPSAVELVSKFQGHLQQSNPFTTSGKTNIRHWVLPPKPSHTEPSAAWYVFPPMEDGGWSDQPSSSASENENPIHVPPVVEETPLWFHPWGTPSPPPPIENAEWSDRPSSSASENENPIHVPPVEETPSWPHPWGTPSPPPPENAGLSDQPSSPALENENPIHVPRVEETPVPPFTPGAIPPQRPSS